MVHFVLSNLASSVQMDLSGSVQPESIPALDVSAVAIFQVSLDEMKSCFQYETDSNDITDANASDIRYYVNPTHWPSLNPVNAMLDASASGASGAIATANNSGVLSSNKMLVAHDFVRYLAQKLFGTHYGVDLFNNEVNLLKDLRAICNDSSSGHTWYDIVSKITAVGTSGTNANIVGTAGSKYMTNADTTTSNLCRELLQQLIGSALPRFSSVLPTDGAQPLPFEENDSISFKLTIAPATGQENLTNVAAFSSRSYEIRLVMVSTTPSNTVVDAAETA